MTVAISRRDAEFIDRLHRLVTERQAAPPPPTGVVGRTADKEPMRRAQMDIAHRWDFDGSIVIGRVDSADGDRYYIGTRSVVTADDDVVVLAQDSDLARTLWTEATIDCPGRTVLKRHLRVRGWKIVDCRTDFNLRTPHPDRPADPQPPTPEPPEPREDTSGDHGDLDDLLAAQAAAVDAAASAADAVREGRTSHIGVDHVLTAWNEALAAAGRMYDLTGADLTLDRVRREHDEREQRRAADAAYRDDLDQKIAALDALIAHGGAGLEELQAARQRLARMRDRTDPPPR